MPSTINYFSSQYSAFLACKTKAERIKSVTYSWTKVILLSRIRAISEFSWYKEAGRVQIRRKGLNARFLIRNKAQSPRILDQVAQFISH